MISPPSSISIVIRAERRRADARSERRPTGLHVGLASAPVRRQSGNECLRGCARCPCVPGNRRPDSGPAATWRRRAESLCYPALSCGVGGVNSARSACDPATERSRAMAWCRHTLDMDAEFVPARRLLAAALVQAGKVEEGLGELERVPGGRRPLRRSPSDSCSSA